MICSAYYEFHYRSQGIGIDLNFGIEYDECPEFYTALYSRCVNKMEP